MRRTAGSARSLGYRSIAGITLLAVAISLTIYHFRVEREKERLQTHFQHLVHDRASHLQDSLDQTLEILALVGGLFEGRHEVTDKEFHLVTKPALARHPEIVAISWAPKVLAGERTHFERRLHSHELGEHGIGDVTMDATDVKKAPERPVYFPILFSEPMDRNRTAIGTDPYARRQNRPAMDAAVRLGGQTTSEPFTLVQDRNGPLAVAIFQPIFECMQSCETPMQRREALRGFVIISLQPAVSIEAELARQSSFGLDIRLLDPQHQPALIHHRSHPQPDTEILLDETMQGDYPLLLPQRNWTLRIAATSSFHARNRSNEPMIVLFAGLSLSALLGLLLLAHVQQNQRQNKLLTQLRRNEQRLRQTFEINSAIKLLIDPKGGRIIDANSAACEFYGYDRDTLLSMRINDINVLPDEAIAAEMLLAKSEQRLYFNFQHRLANGEIRDVEVYSGPVETENDRLLYSIVHDVTQRKHMEQALRESESRFQQLAENLDSVFWIATPGMQQIIYVSPAYERLWGRSAERLYRDSADWFEAILEEDRSEVRRQIPAATESSWQRIQFDPYRIRLPDGTLRWISSRAYPIHDDAGQIIRIAGIADDITERQSYQQHLLELAHYDTLTHLPNRRLLADRMHLALAHSKRANQMLGICMLDLDSFKPVNDLYGHKVGDLLLIEVARRLQESVRSDDTVARLGGDEFVLLLGELGGLRELEEALRRLLHVLSLPYAISELPIMVSASIGVTVYPNDSGDADTLLRHADHAMYLAKEAGKNRFILFNPVLEERERDNRAALELIRKAVADNQLRLHYQPIVDCRRGMVVGMEALLRWQHPILGMMGPAEFLPLVETDDNLALSVGAWVIRQALCQAETWRLTGLDVPVSVNVFVQQLRDHRFPDLLSNLLAEHPDLPADRLCIEILESTALDDFASVNRLIQRCAGWGVRFALDDFGTGFSSLTYLRQLPVNSLKIDQSFVRDMLRDPEDLTIVEGVVGLGTAFRHHVVAEGVESTDHALMLMEMGCHLVQGFGIAKPMPAEATQAWIKEFKPDPRWLENAARRLSRDDFQLVLAEVNHRQWLASLRNWMSHDPDHRAEAPQLDGHECNFGHWYYGEGRNRYGHLPAYRAAESLHDRVHRLARQLVNQCESGDIRACRESEAALIDAAEAFRDALARIRTAVKYDDAGQ